MDQTLHQEVYRFIRYLVLDENGFLRTWRYKAENGQIFEKKEFRPFSQGVLDIAWTQDAQRIAISGIGKDRYGLLLLWGFM